MDIAQVLTRRFKGAEWTLNGETYDGLTWLSPDPKPTKKTLESHWADVQQEMADEVATREAARLSAIAKLEALGLTVDEVSAAFGLEA